MGLRDLVVFHGDDKVSLCLLHDLFRSGFLVQYRYLSTVYIKGVSFYPYVLHVGEGVEYIIAAVYLKTEAVYPFELYIALHVKIHVCSGVFGELVAKQGDDIINFLGGLCRTEDSSVIAVLVSRH